MEFSNKGISYEEICLDLNYQFASRTTILNILDEGVKLDFFTKQIDTKDRRKQNYHLSNICRSVVYDWLENHPFLDKKL